MVVGYDPPMPEGATPDEPAAKPIAARRVAALGLLMVFAPALVLAVDCVRHAARSGGGGGTWYDPQPLLASIRADARAALAEAAGVQRLDELPLYHLELDLDLDRKSFALRESVWLTQLEPEPLEDIELTLPANVTAAGGTEPTPLVRFTKGRCSAPLSCAVTSVSPTTVRVVPERALARGDRLRIELELEGTLREIEASRTNVLSQGLEGLGSIASGARGGDYGVLAIGDGIASLGNFHAVLARRKDGQWVKPPRTAMGDLGPDAIVNVRAELRVPAGVRVVTTGVELAPPRDEGQRKHVQVGAAAVRDFAVLAGRSLESKSREVGPVTVRSHFLPADAAAGERVLDAAAHALEIYERRFGAYPYVDLDVSEAALVGGAGGVEFSGLVTVASMLYRPATAGGGDGVGALLGLLGGGSSEGLLAGMKPILDSMLEFCVAHEVAHQYWHTLVGSDSRQHPYLDEALAQWSAVLYMEERYGQARADREADMQVKAGYQTMRLLGQPDGAANAPVDTFTSQLGYAGLIYGKAPYYYAALRREVGDEAFFAALREYVSKHRFRIAPPGALEGILGRGGKQAELAALERRWLREAHGDEDLGKLDLAGMVSAMLGGQGGELGQMMGLLQSILGESGLEGLDPEAADAGARKAPARPDAGTR